MLSMMFSKSFVRGRHTQTETHRDRQNLQAGTDSDSYNRKTEDGRYREHEVENSDLDSLLVKMIPRGRIFFLLIMQCQSIIGVSELITNVL